MGQEQRQFSRVPMPFDASCRIYGALADPWHPIATLDLSAGGMSFQAEQLFDVEDKLEIKILLPSASQPLVLYGQLLWSKAPAPNITECGVQFVDVGPGQQVQLDELVRFVRKKS